MSRTTTIKEHEGVVNDNHVNKESLPSSNTWFLEHWGVLYRSPLSTPKLIHDTRLFRIQTFPS
jgi:hypothetical protein